MCCDAPVGPVGSACWPKEPFSFWGQCWPSHSLGSSFIFTASYNARIRSDQKCHLARGWLLFAGSACPLLVLLLPVSGLGTYLVSSSHDTLGQGSIGPWVVSPSVAPGHAPRSSEWGREGQTSQPLAWPALPGMVPTQVLSFFWRPPGVILGPAPFLPPSKVTQLSPVWPSIPLEGKKQVWQYDVIPILVDLLKDHVEEVQANAAGALMYATVTTAGELACWPGTEVGRASLCVGIGANWGGEGHRSPPACWLPQPAFHNFSSCTQCPGTVPPCPAQVFLACC